MTNPIFDWQRLFALVRNAALLFGLIALCMFWERAFFSLGFDGVTLKKSGPLEWKGDLGSLSRGNYFVSAGRPRGRCELQLGEQTIATTGQEDTLRHALGLGAPLRVFSQETRQVKATCAPQEGFASGISDSVVVASPKVGRVLQFFRELFEIWTGVAFSFYLLVVVWLLAPPYLESNPARKHPTEWSRLPILRRAFNPFVTFGFVALGYGVSLSFATWLLFPPFIATTIHVLLRILVSFFFIRLVFAQISSRDRTFKAHIVLYAGLFLTFLYLAVFDSNILVKAYVFIHPVFGLTTGLAFLELWRDRDADRRTDGLLSLVTLTWTAAQLMDSLLNHASSGLYSGPFVLAIVTCLVALVRSREVEFSRRTETTTRAALLLQNENQPVDEALKETAKICFGETAFVRLSVYIDAYCIGRSTQPHLKLVRSFETGYAKDTSKDLEIQFQDDRGTIMQIALEEGRPKLGTGRDGGAYMVVPIGSLACINFSNSQACSARELDLSVKFIERLMPAIQTIKDRLLTTNLLRNLFLQKVKMLRGCGEWDTRFGAIMLDVNGYTKHVETVKALSGGKDLYSPFIMGQYLPALLKYLPYAELELDAGDMLYLVILEDLLPESVPIQDACVVVLKRIMEFCDGPGARLCCENGFPVARMSGGACLGIGKLLCGEFKVRTSGAPPNLCGRMLGVKLDETILLDATLSFAARTAGLQVGAAREFLSKTDTFSASPLYYPTYLRKVP